MKNVILMVDDNSEMRSLFADLLSCTPFRVVTFANPREAQIYLESAENRDDVRAIVSDVMMGPMDGLEFLAYLKATPELASIDFFLFTGADVSLFKPFLSQFTIKGVIEKPFCRTELLDMLNSLLEAPSQKSAA